MRLKAALASVTYQIGMSIVHTLDKIKYGLLPPSASIVFLLADNFIIHHCLFAASDLRLADRLAQGPRHIDMLAEEANVNSDALYRIMRALATKNIFREIKPGIFCNTRLSLAFAKQYTQSILPWLQYFGSVQHRGHWDVLPTSVKNGECAMLNQNGQHPFQWMRNNTDYLECFNEGMRSVSLQVNKVLSAAYNFSHADTLIDIGGGNGSFLQAILQKNKKVNGILYDLPETIDKTKEHLDQNIADRMRLVSGDMFTSIPQNGDIYLLKSVLHDWDDTDVVGILQNCRSAMHDKSKLLIIETLIDNKTFSKFNSVIDVAMLVLSGGKERTYREFAALVTQSGLKMTHVIRTASPFSILEVKKA